MLISPRKTKFKKAFKGTNKGFATSGCEVIFGQYGIQILDNILMKANTLQALFRIISKRIKSSGRIWQRVFPHKPISKKPIEVRMGKGKGAVDHYAAALQSGKILFEFDGVSHDEAKKIFDEAIVKVGAKCRLLVRNFGNIC
jgi:large subunit ribosomal protein L16